MKAIASRLTPFRSMLLFIDKTVAAIPSTGTAGSLAGDLCWSFLALSGSAAPGSSMKGLVVLVVWEVAG